ncbi:MAG: response regulator transcription factor [Saprospiraceae bacterium]|nr:response regulator transcription factor [Saprospiraceae bacterium]
MGDKVRVVVADAQVLCRVGLVEVLKEAEEIEVVGEAGDGESLLEAISMEHPDIVIIDYNQPGYFDSKIAGQIKGIAPDTDILVISSDDRKERIYQVLEDGVNSFLTKQCDEVEILEAVRATAKGDKFYCHKILDLIIERSFPSKSENCTATPLSPREKEILTLVAKGKIAKEIAAELHISPHTIYTHRKNILKKLKLTSPTEMIVYALEHGLIELDTP